MSVAEFPWLTAILVFPLVAAFAIPFIPDKYGKNVRSYAVAVAFAELSLIIYGFWQRYNLNVESLQMIESYDWMPQLGLKWSLAVDGLSMPLIVLTGLVTTLAIFAGGNVKQKPRLFYFLMLCLYSAQIGVFAAQDLLLFFLMWELELVPVYLLISIWGGAKRLYAATKFILYTAIGSIFILVAGLAMAFYGDTTTFNMTEMGLKQYPIAFELLAYAGFLIAFGVKLPIFPLHTWLPDAHGEASAPVSMVLAGVLLKMGGYALIRFNIEMLPNAHVYFAPLLAVLGVVGIVYGAIAAFGQQNLKRRLAYSSISHMGFILIGLASFNTLGLSGAMLQMLSHGLIAAALFFLAGVTYERTHTLMMDEMGGIAKVMPKAFALMTASAMASLALPGMSGFVSELKVFLGITSSDVYSANFKLVMIVIAAFGVIVTPIYLLSTLRQVFYGTTNASLHFDKSTSDANPREVFIAACLIVPIIAIGLYPKLATQTYDVKTVALTEQARGAFSVVAQSRDRHPIYSLKSWTSPTLPNSASQPLLGLMQ
ncbi:MAG: NAD(P)H-quinone oxidoreductase subunit 4 [Pseudanabaenaceae cyanobacterium bins.39]|nr:NAD(P)H-quinone oxidoreductase subunit 4 [Pseudanabaenaceae cyanobacterium bins.39]